MSGLHRFPAPMTAVAISHACVSAEDQNLDLQRDVLERAGCGRIHEKRAERGRIVRAWRSCWRWRAPVINSWSGGSTAWATPCRT